MHGLLNGAIEFLNENLSCQKSQFLFRTMYSPASKESEEIKKGVFFIYLLI